MPVVRLGCSRMLRVAAVPMAAFAAGLLVLSSSYSVFSTSTSSPANSWSTGTVLLENDSTAWGSQSVVGSALFSVTNLKPNAAVVVRCVTVRYSGSLAAPVRMSMAGPSQYNSLMDYLNMSIETVSGATDASCTGATSPTVLYSGTVYGFGSTYQYPDHANSLATGWTPSITSTQQFRITVQPDDARMTNAQQDSSAGFQFVWQAQNS